MPTLALLTCADLPKLDDDERPVLAALAARGVVGRPIAWTEGVSALAGCDAVVLRSCWNYHLHEAAFRAYLSDLDDVDVPVFNPPATLRWNLDKRYLLELEAAGLDVLPTRCVARGDARELAAVFAETGWSEAVVKPVISASGWETWRVTRAEADTPDIRARWSAAVARHDLLVQLFAPEILDEGEWSFVFLGGELSHCVLKRPAGDEFRVQAEYGGSKLRVDPPARLLARARDVLDACPGRALYARVDGLRRAGTWQVMEVELIDPALYLTQAPDVVPRWADVLAQVVS
jgi:glutathione synthase/RimK-type ligase-like ATP-grasp enzyme